MIDIAIRDIHYNLGGYACVDRPDLEKGIEKIYFGDGERLMFFWERGCITSLYKEKYENLFRLMEGEIDGNLIHETIHIVIYKLEGLLPCLAFDNIDASKNGFFISRSSCQKARNDKCGTT